MNMENKKARRKTDYSSHITFGIGGILFFAGGMMVMQVIGEDSKIAQPIESTQMSSHQFDKRVSLHLQELYHKRAIERLKTRIENNELLLKSKVQNGAPPAKRGSDLGISGIDLNAEQLPEGIDPGSKASHSAEDRIQQGFMDAQNDYAENRMLREEYIKAFRENARRDGFEVQIDKNLNIISIDPINP